MAFLMPEPFYLDNCNFLLILKLGNISPNFFFFNRIVWLLWIFEFSFLGILITDCQFLQRNNWAFDNDYVKCID